jgi:hypothetical protein
MLKMAIWINQPGDEPLVGATRHSAREAGAGGEQEGEEEEVKDRLDQADAHH